MKTLLTLFVLLFSSSVVAEEYSISIRNIIKGIGILINAGLDADLTPIIRLVLFLVILSVFIGIIGLIINTILRIFDWIKKLFFPKE